MVRGKKSGRTPEQLVRFNKFAEWYFTPERDRVPGTAQEICAELHVSNVTGTKWKHELDGQRGYTNDEQKEWMEQAKKMAYEGGNSKALELLGKAKGFLAKEKEEGKIELTADEYYAILREARNRVSADEGKSGGVGSLPDELPVLSQALRKDTDEGKASADGEVGGLAVPDRPCGPVFDGQQSDNRQSEAAGDIVAGSGLRFMADSI